MRKAGRRAPIPTRVRRTLSFCGTGSRTVVVGVVFCASPARGLEAAAAVRYEGPPSRSGAASPMLGPPDDCAAAIFSFMFAWYFNRPRSMSSSDGESYGGYERVKNSVKSTNAYMRVYVFKAN